VGARGFRTVGDEGERRSTLVPGGAASTLLLNMGDAISILVHT